MITFQIKKLGLLLCFVAAPILLVSQSSHAGEKQSCAELTAIPPSNQNQKIRLIIKNTEQHKLTVIYGSRTSETDYTVDIQDENRNSPDITSEEQSYIDHDNPGFTEAREIQLNTGESFDENIDISSRFSLRQGQVYKVSFSKRVMMGSLRCLLVSNPIYLSK